MWLQNLRNERVNSLVILASVVLFIFIFYYSRIAQNVALGLVAVGIGLVILALVHQYRRYLLLKEAPISTIAAAAQGYVELYGQARAIKPTKTPYQALPCVWYRAWVYANFAQKQRDHDWRDHQLLNYDARAPLFLLDDGTGECVIDPQGAEVIYFEARTWRKHDHRYVEHYLPANKPLYVIGHLDSRQDELDKEAFTQAVNQELNLLKSNPAQLLNRYDHNLNGKIDLHEWEMAREVAIAQVNASQAMRAHTGRYTLAKPKDGHLFLISARSPLQLRQHYRRWMLIHLTLLGLFSGICLILT